MSGRALLVLSSRAIREKAIDWIMRLPAGTRVEFKGPQRTLEQNDKLWAMWTDVSSQHCIDGRRYSPTDWRLIFLTAYAEEMGMEIRHLPAIHRAGLIPCGRSSSDLSVREASELIEWMLAWGAEQNPPIVWSDPKPATEGARSREEVGA